MNTGKFLQSPDDKPHRRLPRDHVEAERHSPALELKLHLSLHSFASLTAHPHSPIAELSTKRSRSHPDMEMELWPDALPRRG